MESGRGADGEETKLRAEMAILRSQLRRVERENSELRKEKSLFYLSKHEEEKEYKRRLSMFQKEYQIKSTQSMCTNKENTAQDSLVRSQAYHRLHAAAERPEHTAGGAGCLDGASIDLRYALKMSIDLESLGSEEEIEKLKFFRDYFFDDFYSIDTDAVVQAIQRAGLGVEAFITVFKLFCCKKAVFEAFCTRALEAPFFLSDQVYILENVPLCWVCDCVADADEQDRSAAAGDDAAAQEDRSNNKNNSVRNFITKNSRSLLRLFGSLAEARPGLLKTVLTQDTFDYALARNSAEARRLVGTVCRHGGLGYINERNLHLVPRQALFACYGDDVLM